MVFMILLCIFSLTVVVLNLIKYLLTRKQNMIKQRLKSAVASNEKKFLINHEKKAGIRRLLFASRFFVAIVDRKYMDRLQAVLVKAGLPLKPEEMIFICILSFLSVGILVLTVSRNAVWSSLSAATGTILPVLWVKWLIRRRTIKIEGQLLGTVVLLASSLRAGHSFLQAVELISRETQPPLSDEFARLMRETRVGLSVEEALVNLSCRTDSTDLEMVISGVLIQRQVGGNLGEVLDQIANTIEKRIKMRAKVRALTAQGRLSGWILSIMPFALAVFVFGKNPQYAQIMLTEPLGRIMLIVGTISLLLGVLIMKKVVAVDV